MKLSDVLEVMDYYDTVMVSAKRHRPIAHFEGIRGGDLFEKGGETFSAMLKAKYELAKKFEVKTICSEFPNTVVVVNYEQVINSNMSNSRSCLTRTTRRMYRTG